MSITRYFDATIDGHQRIQVVTADDESGFDGLHSLDKPREFQPDELPADFASWRRYEAFAVSGLVVEVKSRNGD